MKLKPEALDLFCKAGGASMGLHRAGFEVTGVDIEPQPRYPFRFIQADALEFPLDGYDFIWASPPCQSYSIAAQVERMNGRQYADLVAPVRERLLAAGTPWVIENVPGSPIRPDLILCGSHFGLQLVRHRWFECGFPCYSLLPPCAHHPDPITVCGHGTPSWVRAKRDKTFTQQEKRVAMGIEWMNRGELAQAIPPAYGEYIGKMALKNLEVTA